MIDKANSVHCQKIVDERDASADDKSCLPKMEDGETLAIKHDLLTRTVGKNMIDRQHVIEPYRPQSPACCKNGHQLEPYMLSYDQAAHFLGFTPQALRDLVYKKTGPVHSKFGTRTMFIIDDLRSWAREHRKPSNISPDVAAPSLIEKSAPPLKRKRGRPTIEEKMARQRQLALGD